LYDDPIFLPEITPKNYKLLHEIINTYEFLNFNLEFEKIDNDEVILALKKVLIHGYSSI